jgi:hypothetical protein
LKAHKIWLLKLILPVPYGNVLSVIVLLAILLPFFYLGVIEDPEHSTPALFFSLIIAYIIPVFSYITAKSQEALLELRPQLDMDDLEFQQAQASLDSVSGGKIALQLGAGALGAFIHMSFIRGSISAAVTTMLTSLEGFVSTLGALLVWIIMTTVIYMLIQQARLFSRLGAERVSVSLFNTHKLLPFARVSISSSLAIIGALALFPLMGLESGMNLVESLPGAIATSVPLLAIFFIPVWPLHRRLAAMKKQQLATLNDQIEKCLEEPGEITQKAETLGRITPLLTYRREITDVSTWPIDLGNVTRFSFYLVLVPLTWVAAALIENLVDAVL